MGGDSGSGRDSGRNKETVQKAPGRQYGQWRGCEDGWENEEGPVEPRDSTGRITTVSHLWGEQEERREGALAVNTMMARPGLRWVWGQCMPHLGQAGLDD